MARNQFVFRLLRPNLRLTKNNSSIHCFRAGSAPTFRPSIGWGQENMAIKRLGIAIVFIWAVVGRLTLSQEISAAVPKGEHRISFHVRGDYILVPARVNGQQATLLLDTGATLSTFSIKILPTMNTDHRITMNLAKGSVSAVVVTAGFTLGDSEIKEQHCSFRRNIVVGDFKFGEADGVIGLDILSSFKAVTFDFKDSVLVLQDR